MKTAIFDFDGTIVDSVPLIYTVVNRVLKKFNYTQLTEKEAENLRSKNTIQILKESGIPFWKMPFMVSFAYEAYNEEISKIKPFIGIREIFQELKNENVSIGIISSNTNNLILKILSNFDFPEIDFLYTSKNLGGKQKMIGKCIKKYKLQKESTVYIGDEIRDIEASQKNGIRCIGVTWGFNTKESLLTTNPYAIVENVKDLSSKIKTALNE